MILLWVLAFALLCYAYAAVYKSLYPAAADRLSYYTGIARNPALVAVFGRAYSSSLGALIVQRVGVLFLVAGLVSALFTIRHTRAEEESGRLEVVGATMVGRQASLAAALTVTTGINVVVGLLTALGQMATGLPAAGSAAFGLSLAAAGCAFMGVAAVAAQVTGSSGAARGMTIGVLAATYLLRAVGDAAGSSSGLSWLSWASPFGWIEKAQPFSGERWAFFLIVAGFLVMSLAGTLTLSAHRDLGNGIIPARQGPEDARDSLNNVFALGLRLNRGALIGWTLGFALAGLVLGGVAKSAGGALGNTGNAGLHNMIQRMGGHSGISDAYLTSVMGILGLTAAGYAIQSVLRLRGEETRGRAEYLLATAQPRLRWAWGQLSLALAGPAVALAAAGLTGGLAYGLSGHDVSHQIPRIVAEAVIQVPAVWVLTGIAATLFGVRPRFTAVSWAALGACLLVGQIGAALQLNQTVQDISPFTDVPKVLGSNVTALPLAILTVIGVLLITIGLIRLRTRDLGSV
jgi:ABC-2 type transport system permease protein